MEEDFKTSVVPKVATKVATSVIQIKSSRRGYCKKSNIGGKWLKQYSYINKY